LVWGCARIIEVRIVVAFFSPERGEAVFTRFAHKFCRHCGAALPWHHKETRDALWHAAVFEQIAVRVRHNCACFARFGPGIPYLRSGARARNLAVGFAFSGIKYASNAFSPFCQLRALLSRRRRTFLHINPLRAQVS